jgi:hypothetical protein
VTRALRDVIKLEMMGRRLEDVCQRDAIREELMNLKQHETIIDAHKQATKVDTPGRRPYAVVTYH